MKKILAVLVAMMLVLSMNVSADITTDGEVGYSTVSQIAYIEGNLNNCPISTGDSVTILLADAGGNIGYINEIPVADDGSYSLKFEFKGNIDDYTLRIKEGKNDVNASVNVAKVESTNLFTLKYGLSTNEAVQAVTKIENKYGSGGTYRVVTAFYDDNDLVKQAYISDELSYSFNDIISEIKADKYEIPQGTKYSKIYIWNNQEEMMPLASDVRRNVGDMSFGGETEQITVAFIGDSITHQAYYLRGIEHYYQTRYPDKDIIFVNKGVSGENAANVDSRFDWEITEDKYSGKIDEATIMIGMNDVLYYYNQGTADAAITRCLTNIETIINKCVAKDIKLTLITPSAYDDTAEFNTSASNSAGFNTALGEVAAGMKELGEKYELPVIDLWTPTTDITEEKRLEGNTDEIIIGSDRIHPNVNGGYYMAYEFVKQQNPSSVIAEVAINAQSGTVKTENAAVTLTSNTDERVEYTYSPKAIPVAYSDEYKYVEGLDSTITDAINREIIKVDGLKAGTYKITVGDGVLTETYSDAQLAEGVNIAVDSNNPGQIQAMSVWAKSKDKVSKESNYRAIAYTETKLIQNKGFTSDSIVNGEIDALITAAQELIDSGTGISYYLNNYVSEDAAYSGSKLNQAATYASIRTQEQEARALAKPETYNVVIELQN